VAPDLNCGAGFPVAIAYLCTRYRKPLIIPKVIKRRISMWASWRVCCRYHCLTLWPCFRLAYSSTIRTPSTNSWLGEVRFATGPAALPTEALSALGLAGLAVGLRFSLAVVNMLSVPRLGVGSPAGGHISSLPRPGEKLDGVVGAMDDAKSVLT
jgi:hypothetical protein